MENEIFQYLFRKGSDKSKIWLIEFWKVQDADRLIGEILKLLDELNFKAGEIEEIWMNDEILINASSQEGEIVISRDIYDLVFILPKDESNLCIRMLENELNQSNKFQRIPEKN